ncbi:MAG: hypothetical protein F6J94_26215 [Moorea sp. SIO1F2]|uniref:hypothetical protein n=1 Tax=Moorena sp. SIO1F2 TaxID=2607819 RepID=UPI0013BE30B3|nr:hypothetical protein [Moorena sp. SIO1F2]NET85277.1 hypothetical protein [Moorena sp. SIO1F2]
MGKYYTEGNFIIYPDYLPTRQVRSHSERVGSANTIPKAISSSILTICPPYYKQGVGSANHQPLTNSRVDRNSIG